MGCEYGPLGTKVDGVRAPWRYAAPSSVAECAHGGLQAVLALARSDHDVHGLRRSGRPDDARLRPPPPAPRQAGRAVDHERDARLALARPGGAGEAQLRDAGLEQGTERLRGAVASAVARRRGGPRAPRREERLQVRVEARRALLIRSGTGRGGGRGGGRWGAAAPPPRG